MPYDIVSNLTHVSAVPIREGTKITDPRIILYKRIFELFLKFSDDQNGIPKIREKTCFPLDLPTLS